MFLSVSAFAKIFPVMKPHAYFIDQSLDDKPAIFIAPCFLHNFLLYGPHNYNGYNVTIICIVNDVPFTWTD